MKNLAIVIFRNLRTGLREDLEIPLDITADDLFMALNEAYHLTDERTKGYLKSENPINFLKGSRKLSEYGLHDGTTILYS